MKGLLKRQKKKEVPKRQKRDGVSKSIQDWKKKRRERVQKPKRNKSKTPKQNKYAYKNPIIKKITIRRKKKFISFIYIRK